MSSIQLPIVRPSRPPWNKNRLIGQKRPLLPRQVWAIRARLELAGDQRNLVLFNLANFAGVILFAWKWAISSLPEQFETACRSSRARQAGQFNSKCPRTRDDRLSSGSDRPPCLVASSSFQAGSTVRRTFRPGNTHVSSATGCRSSDWTPADMARILFDGQRLR